MTNRNFPYPLKTNKLTVYGIKGCPYCAKMKDIALNIRGSIYHDIDELINNGLAKSFDDFKLKIKPFINNYDMVPMVFVYGDFIGGHDNFIKAIKNEAINKYVRNNKKNALSVISNDIKKEEKELLRLLDGLSKKNRPRKTA
jgi:glutaredoxin